jgi:hypothetical protein
LCIFFRVVVLPFAFDVFCERHGRMAVRLQQSKRVSQRRCKFYAIVFFFGLEHMQERVQLFCDAARWFHPNALCEMPTLLSLRLVAELALVFENKTPDGSECFVSKDKGTKKQRGKK